MTTKLPSSQVLTTTDLIKEIEKSITNNNQSLGKSNYVTLDKLYHMLTQTSTNKQLFITHFNTRSLNKNFDNLNIFLRDLPTRPNIICISETKLKQSNNFNINLKDYTFINNNSNTKSGGVGMYIDNSTTYALRLDLEFKIESCENLWIEIKTTKNSKNIVVGIIYRHPTHSFTDFSNKLTDTILKIDNQKLHYYILGDININILKQNTCKATKDYIDNLHSLNSMCIINKPTRITSSTATLIDHIYTNHFSNQDKSGIIIFDISDHLPIYCIINITKQKKSMQRPKIRKIHVNKTKLYLSELYSELTKLESVMTTDINNQTNNLIQIIQMCSEKYFPLVAVSRKKIRKTPWMTPDLLHDIEEQNRLYKHCYKHDNQQKIKEYKILRNKVTRLKIKAKQEYFKELFNKYQNNSKKTWETINTILQRKPKLNALPDTLLINDHDTHEKETIAESLNLFFANIGLNMAHSIPIATVPYKRYLKNPIQNSMYMFETATIEITNIINDLKDKKATGPDNISVKILKLSRNIIAPFLTKIINTCLNEGTYPDTLKISKIVPIYKTGDKKLMKNYRPISLLPLLNKIFEKVIQQRLLDFFNDHNVIGTNQFGFRKNYSTNLAIVDLHEYFLRQFEEDNTTCCIFLDLAKAFDTVNHNILLGKLEHYGIRGIPNKLITSYLRNRKQYITQDKTKTGLEDISCGVPQGSILAPLFFTIYVNDLTYSSTLDNKMFADDTVLYASSRNLAELNIIINKEFSNVNKWLQTNRLSLNKEKTKFMLIHRPTRKPIDNFEVVIENTKLEQVGYIKYLGVYIDSNLTWKKHIEHLHSKLSQSCGMLSKIRHYVNKPALHLLYNSLVLSHINYGILAWESANKCNLKKIQVLQNRIIKLITFTEGERIKLSSLYQNLKYLKIDQIYKLEVGKFMFKYVKNILPCNFNPYFDLIESTHNHFTRQTITQKYNLNRPKLNKSKAKLSYIGVLTWGKIPRV